MEQGFTGHLRKGAVAALACVFSLTVAAAAFAQESDPLQMLVGVAQALLEESSGQERAQSNSAAAEETAGMDDNFAVEDETSGTDGNYTVEDETSGVDSTAAEENSTLGENTYNILLVGSDRRDDSWNGNSDTMILVTVNYNTSKISMVSFMRDLGVDIPGNGTQKLNAAFAIGGISLLEETLKNNFRVRIDNYAAVDFY